MTRRIVGFAAIAAALFLAGAGRPPRRGRLLWPLPEDAGITSSFGDLRGDHLHGGVDLSTGGEAGRQVRAVADGEIVRLKVEWRGYGNALYLKHAGGDESVYGHLQEYENGRFHLADRVRRAQAEKNTRYPGNIEVAPPIPVRRGDIIALSGESGTGLPHLHFEWRARDGTEPTDPRLAGLPSSAVASRVTIDEVFATPEGSLRVAARVHTERHSFGLSRLDVRVDGKPYYAMDLSRMDFSSYLLPGAVYDLARSEESRRLVYSCDPIGAALWPRQVRGGAAPLLGAHRVIVKAWGAERSPARWEGRVEGPAAIPPEENARVSRLAAETAGAQARLELPNGTLHPGIPVEVASPAPGMIEIEPRRESARPGARLRWTLPAGAPARRLGIYRVSALGEIQSTGSTVSGQEISAPIHRFGRFLLKEDDRPPALSRLRLDRCFFGPCLKVDVSDDLSGLTADSVVFEWPGSGPVLAEVDPDRGWATVPAPPSADLGAVRVRAEDRAGNVATMP